MVGEETLCRGDHCICASACFFIWAAGIYRSGDAFVVHRPRDISGLFGKKPAAQASREYAAMLGAIREYLVRMEVPSVIIDMIEATSSDRHSFLTESDVNTYVEGYTRGIHEWLAADCTPLTPEELDKMVRFRDKKAKQHDQWSGAIPLLSAD